MENETKDLALETVEKVSNLSGVKPAYIITATAVATGGLAVGAYFATKGIKKAITKIRTKRELECVDENVETEV